MKPETQDLVVGIREIPFRLAAKELKDDLNFMEYAIQIFSHFPGSTYQIFLNAQNYENTFAETLRRLSVEDWVKIEEYDKELIKQQESCDIFSKMIAYQREVVIGQRSSYSEIVDNGSSEMFPKSRAAFIRSSEASSNSSTNTTSDRSTMEAESDAYSSEILQKTPSVYEINFLIFQTSHREINLPKQNDGNYYSPYFRMAVNYFVDYIGKKVEQDLMILKSEFESFSDNFSTSSNSQY